MINSKNKGSNGEREFAKWIKYNLNLDFAPRRNLEQVRNGGADFIDIYPFVFEIKRNENLNLLDAWIQVKNEAQKIGGEPVVAFRRNRKKWEFLISANHIGCNIGFLHIHSESCFLEWARAIIGTDGLFVNRGNVDG